jgi:ArsR family transcriptional regulator
MVEKEDSLCCECNIVHKEMLEVIRKNMVSDNILQFISELFKNLSDPTRLKIINALILSEMCVCDISALLKMTQPAISHHLKTLRQTNLINYRRKGKAVYYSLDDECVKSLFNLGLTHITEQMGGII